MLEGQPTLVIRGTPGIEASWTPVGPVTEVNARSQIRVTVSFGRVPALGSESSQAPGQRDVAGALPAASEAVRARACRQGC